MRNVYNVKTESTGKRAYMQCKGAKKYHSCDNNKAIRMDELEQILLNAINDLLDNYYDETNLQNLYDQTNKQNTNDETINILKKEKNNLEKKINDNKNYYRNLYEDKVKGNINEEMFSLMANDYLKEIETMTNRIETIENEINNLNTIKENKKQANDILKKYKVNDNLKNFKKDKIPSGKSSAYSGNTFDCNFKGFGYKICNLYGGCTVYIIFADSSYSLSCGATL